MSSHDDDTLLQSDDAADDEQYFTNDDLLNDPIQNDTTASPSPDNTNNNQLNANAEEFLPLSFISPDVWVGRTFSQQEFVDCLAALRQVNLLVLEGEQHPKGMQKYFFFVALRTPLTHLTGWTNIIHHLNMTIKQDFLPSEREEDISSLISLYCEQLAYGEPVLENRPIRHAMLNFISGKYLGREIRVHYMN